jgi:hypothetical protein
LGAFDEIGEVNSLFGTLIIDGMPRGEAMALGELMATSVESDPSLL